MARPAPSIGALIAAVLLPPLAVYLARGLGPSFWIGVLLTLFWWVPGVIYALAILFAPMPVATSVRPR
ncbi:YqaE/Pmp3 family membrane protein [Sphingomonas sp. AP4-R1]|uniref:YqaE/Pmp3 family membrane protein n=1 Tax=Sphingomonas sp. AP4-R1 TaxID=2735134 RepID=UPI00149396BE|nr:YqaE/Pmp3 family membrane protein [Sphingomonas sp. AP4-R1]QJU56798.1 YqaE/Pmp3 family membrane protein [Sphingomonas sp. AP4-R1]